LNPLRLQRVPTDLATLLDDVLALLEPNVAQKRMSVVRRGWDVGARIGLDAHLMEQALHGLLLNAVDASPAGGELSVALSALPFGMRLTIGNAGAGIGFVPRPGGLSPGPTTKRMGTGLGIPFAMKVCELHGGRIEFSRPAVGGTVVIVDLPQEVEPIGTVAAHA